jgi:mRNA interferase RelE/StbE
LAARILAALDRYAAAGHGDVIHLQGRPDYRLRIGTWRAVFHLDQAARRIVVLTLAPRRDVYRP